MTVLVTLLLAAAADAAVARGETAAAREQARRCLELPRESGVDACRGALALGLVPARAVVVRRTLALKLIALERGREAVEVYRDAVRARPEDAEARLRLGQALLSILGDAEAALRLDPDFLLSRPGARRAYDAALRGERWPPAVKPTPPPP